MPLFHAMDAAFPSALLEARVRSTTREAKCGSIGLKRRKLLVGVLETRTAQPAGMTGLRIGHVRRQRKTGGLAITTGPFFGTGPWVIGFGTAELASAPASTATYQAIKGSKSLFLRGFF